MLFTFELAERFKNSHVTVNCLHPGLVKTDIGNKDAQWYARIYWLLWSRLKGISIKDGAKTSIYLASSDEVKGVSGKYFSNCVEKKASDLAKDKDLQKELWVRSEQCCKI